MVSVFNSFISTFERILYINNLVTIVIKSNEISNQINNYFIINTRIRYKRKNVLFIHLFTWMISKWHVKNYLALQIRMSNLLDCYLKKYDPANTRNKHLCL